MIRTFALAAVAAFSLATAAMAQTSVPTAPEDILSDVYLGADDAPVVVEEYASMTCVHCAAFANETFEAFKAKYIDTGKVRFVIKPFPLDPVSAGAFLLTRCGTDDEYYDRVEHLFATQESWLGKEPQGDALLAAMDKYGMTKEQFDACLNNRGAVNWVVASRDGAKDIVTGTPTFVINGVATKGNLPIETLADIIDPMIETE